MKKLVLIFLFTNFLFLGIFGQYTIQLMNGKVLSVISYDDSLFTTIHFKADKNYLKNIEIEEKNFQLKSDLLNRKEKDPQFNQEKYDLLLRKKTKALKPIEYFESSIDKEEAFSLTDQKGKEKVYYFFEENLGNYYQIDEMRMFINGEKDARKFYKGKTAFWGGVGFGAAGSYASGLGVGTIAAPVVWTLGTLLPVLKIKGKWISDPKYKQYESYKAGFEKTARTKNIFKGLLGSTIGMVSGALIYAVIHPDEVRETGAR
jgi:hypothetical protein